MNKESNFTSLGKVLRNSKRLQQNQLRYLIETHSMHEYET